MSSGSNTRVRVVMSATTAIGGGPTSLREAIAQTLRKWPAKAVADKADASHRTVESWRAARSAPEAEHLIRLMRDDVIGPELLEAIGLGDLAVAKDALDKLRVAKAALDEIAR
jgi:hypothetical protein